MSRGAHLLLVGLLAASLIAPACLARGKTPLTYDQVFGLQALLRTLAPQQTDKLLIDETIQQSGGICDWGCDPLKIWVVLDGKHIDIPLVDHSRIGRPNDELLGKKLPIDSNSPLTLSVNTDIQFKKPDGVAVPAGYFIDALRQVNALIYRFVRRDKGFIAALFSPEIRSISVYLQSSTGTVRLQEGTRVTPLPQAAAGNPIAITRAFLLAHKRGILLFSAPIFQLVPAEG